MYTILRGAISALALVALTAHGSEAPAVLRALQGDWTAQGMAFGGEAVSSMRWLDVLGGEFFRIEYRIDIKRGQSTESFEGVGYYRLQDGSSVPGFWADNSGDLHPITAEISPEAIVSHWGKVGGKQGRTEYRLLEDGSVQVTDWLLTAEGWKQFNKSGFTRVK